MNALIDVGVGVLCIFVFTWLYQQEPTMAVGLLAYSIGNIGMKLDRISRAHT